MIRGAALHTVFAVLSTLSNVAVALDIQPVPHPSSREIHVQHTSRPFRLVSPADGTRVILNRIVMITGARGTVIRPLLADETSPEIVLENGPAMVLAGSPPVSLRLGDCRVRWSDAELLVLPDRGGWSIEVIAASDSAMLSVDSETLPLHKGRRFRLLAGSVLDIDHSTLRKLGQIRSRLLSNTNEPLLPPVEVEPASDRQMRDSTVSTGETEGEFEVEAVEIEIETDCIEICTD